MYPHWLELYEEILTSYIFPCMLSFIEAICMLVRRLVCFSFEASFTCSLVFHFPHEFYGFELKKNLNGGAITN